MNRMPLILSAIVTLIVATSPCAADNLLIAESSSDQVVLVSGFDGSVIDRNFLDIATQAANAGVGSTPIEALEVGNEFWVSDQVADRIWRFDRQGGFLGDVGVGSLDNIRGMELVGDTLYVAQGGSTANAAEGVVMIDVNTQSLLGTFGGPADDISYQDIRFHNGELLVTNSDSGNDGIERFDLMGNFLGDFASSDGTTSFDFAQQINVRDSNGNIIVGGFSVPSGVYEFEADGTELGIVAGLDFGPRAAFELGNGTLAWTNGTWFRSDDTILIEGSSFRYISTTTFVPEPGTTVVCWLAAAILFARRRK